MSTLASQTRDIVKTFRNGHLKVHVRHDDSCRNGHNTFAITADLYEKGRWEAGGCLHDEVAKHAPELAPLIRWHLCSTDGPLHYVANTLYWLGYGKYSEQSNIEHARASACWPDMPESFLASSGATDEAAVRAALLERLPGLLAEFRAAVESFGFTY